MALTQSGEEREMSDKDKMDKAGRTKVRVSPGHPLYAFSLRYFAVQENASRLEMPIWLIAFERYALGAQALSTS